MRSRHVVVSSVPFFIQSSMSRRRWRTEMLGIYSTLFILNATEESLAFPFFSVFSVIATSLLWLAGAKNKILSTLSRLIESFPVQKANGVRWHLKSISKPEDIPFLSIFPSKVLKANRIREDTNKSERLVDLCGATAESEGDNNFFSSVLFLSQVDSILFFLSVSLSLVP